MMQQWNDGHRSALWTNLTLPMASGCLHVCWRQGEAGGGAPEGQDGNVFLRMLIMQLGSRRFFLATRCGWFNTVDIGLVEKPFQHTCLYHLQDCVVNGDYLAI